MRRVLFVDDNELMRKLYLRQCAGRYIGFSAEGVDSALHYLQTIEIDCVITDYALGPQDGIDLLRLVRVRWPHIPVICISGLTQTVTLGVSFDDVLLKPIVGWATVEDAVEAAIKRRLGQ